jgi:site-specific DNA recombinase
LRSCATASTSARSSSAAPGTRPPTSHWSTARSSTRSSACWSNQRYLGNAAHGRSGRYCYYTCYSRQRFGTGACPADRLPADRLEAAVIRALLETYQRTDLFDQAAAQAHTHRKAHLDHYRSELATVRAKLRNTGQAIDRYLRAFERGSMPTDICGPRLTELRAE